MWILSRYADIVSAGQNAEIYSSASGNLMTELPGRAGATLGTTDAPRHESGAWRTVFPAPGLSALDEQRFPHAHDGPPERVIVDRVLSVSYIAALDVAGRARVENTVRHLIASTPGLAGRERVSFPYVTVAARSRRVV